MSAAHTPTLEQLSQLRDHVRNGSIDWMQAEVALDNAINSHAALVAALERMLEVQRVLMPGIRFISVPDYALLNDAPLEARAALKAAKGEA